MKRPIGLTVIGVLTTFVAALLALGCAVSFFIAVMGLTERLSGDAASTAIVGMAVGGGFSLLILALGVAVLANGIFKMQEWAWSASIVSIGVGLGFTLISLFAFRRYVFVPVGVSVMCHVLVLATEVWMLVYLFKPEIKQAFGARTFLPAPIQIRFHQENNQAWLNSPQPPEKDFRKRAS